MNKLLAVVALVALLGAGCTGDAPASMGPLTYVLAGSAGSVLYGESAAGGYFQADNGTAPEGTVCASLDASFPGATAMDYEFVLNKYMGAETAVGQGWSMYVLPNVPGFTSVEEVRAAYDACGIIMWWPQMLTEDYILVTQNCEGFTACMEARDLVEPTLALE